MLRSLIPIGPLVAAVLGLATALSAEPVAADSVDDSISILKGVTTGETGNDAARAAWRRLTAADAAALPKILAALDDASPLSANWLRSALDAIAADQLQSGGTLPAAELERFVVDTGHAPRARRTAYELLLRVDPQAEGRLIPDMLDDPSLEFRRDAVARLIHKAEEQTAAGDKKSATATLEQALTASRDEDQVKAIVKQLEEFDIKVDLARHYGYVLTWKLIGPFDNTNEAGFEVVYPPEQEVDFAKQYAGKSDTVTWIDFTSADPRAKIDLNQGLGKEPSVVGYAAAEFIAPEARPVDLRWQTMNATKVWLNGKLLGANRVYHSGSQIDQYVGHAELQKGRNIILVKACQNEQPEEWAQEWDFQLRVCDATGAAVHSVGEQPASTTSDAAQ